MQVDLVERARTGDHDAFSQLVRLDGDRCYAIAVGIVRDRERAQDVVQQAFLLAWRDLPKLRDPERFEPWLHRLLVRCCYEEARQFRRWTTRVVSLPTEGPGEPGRGDSVVSVVDRDALERAFADLSPEHRAVVLLHHHIGWSVQEVADIVGVPPGTVKSRLHHATRNLRASIRRAGLADESERMPA
jgi:RNA polymerase sigma-70 factor, ECF subfamily